MTMRKKTGNGGADALQRSAEEAQRNEAKRYGPLASGADRPDDTGPDDTKSAFKGENGADWGQSPEVKTEKPTL